MSQAGAQNIADHWRLLRRIAPQHCVDDKNIVGGKRPSSAAFKDPNMSVDAEELLAQNSRDFNFTLRDTPGHSLVRLIASVPRSKGLEVLNVPVPDNDAHSEVRGKKTGSIASALASASQWVVKNWKKDDVSQS